jgi:8-amino-7-oxononanoate synthase
MEYAENFLKNQLQQRTINGLLRKLTTTTLPFDFCSNDYLGFARSNLLKQLINEQVAQLNPYQNGAGGSRLLSGNYQYTENTEQFIADFHKAEAGLIFNSGYDANIGLLSSIPQRGDTIITDELIHASLIDGARLSHAERFKFKHNDLVDLEQKLKNSKGLIYVVVESVYSMDGDLAPLVAISNLCKIYNANLIVDEAHATGIFGPKGEGLVVQLGLSESIFARVVTFGKAMGTHGAIVLGSQNLRNYLVNFARSFIYTTAAPLPHIVAINCAYQLLSQSDYQSQIIQKITLYNTSIKDLKLTTIQSTSAIQTVLFSDIETTKNAAMLLSKKGFDTKAILSPTVAKGKERLRICLHLYNTNEEIKNLVNHLKTFQE